MTKIDRKAFNQIKRIVYQEPGIVLENKQELVESRIASLCRNVMIYFDQSIKENLLRTFYRYMRDGACLFTGHAESINGYHHLFKRVKVAV